MAPLAVMQPEIWDNYDGDEIASGYRQTEESLKNLRAAWGFAHSGGYQALDSYH